MTKYSKTISMHVIAWAQLEEIMRASGSKDTSGALEYIVDQTFQSMKLAKLIK